ncbi:MAG: pentapeptide repeat-containing protein, partial [Acidobacteria bacterium]|nr:pentapeptide repeat-containing protein [Acidobacteriota bacterium]
MKFSLTQSRLTRTSALAAAAVAGVLVAGCGSSGDDSTTTNREAAKTPAGAPTCYPDCSNQNLQGERLTGDLQGINLTGADLQNANLSGATFGEADTWNDPPTFNG